MSQGQKSTEFEFAQVVAAIEKLDIAVNSVFESESISAIFSSLIALMQLVDEDPVLHFVDDLIMKNVNCDIDSWLSKYAQLRGSMVGSGIFKLGNTKQERYCITKNILKKQTENIEKFENFILSKTRNWYYDGNVETLAYKFLKDFLGAFYRELRNSLIDLRVEAELSNDKKISEQQIINIVLSGNVQNVQANNISNSEIAQSE